MSHQTIPTTKDTTGSSSKGAIAKDDLKAFLHKDVLDSLNDFDGAKYWSARPGAEQRPWFLTKELFDMVTNGDIGRPILWTGHPVAVAFIDVSRKEAGLEIYGNTTKYTPVTF